MFFLKMVLEIVKSSESKEDAVKKIEDLITEKTVAILPVHVYGNICNVEKIQEKCKQMFVFFVNILNSFEYTLI